MPPEPVLRYQARGGSCVCAELHWAVSNGKSYTHPCSSTLPAVEMKTTGGAFWVISANSADIPESLFNSSVESLEQVQFIVLV